MHGHAKLNFQRASWESIFHDTGESVFLIFMFTSWAHDTWKQQYRQLLIRISVIQDWNGYVELLQH